MLAFDHRIAAHLPSTIVQTGQAIGKTLLTNGIQCTANGLAERSFPGQKGTLQRTKTIVALITSKDTILSANNAGHQVAVAIGVGHALRIDDRLGRGRQVAPDSLQARLHLADFIQRDRRAGITFYTTDALAFLVVTAKIRRDNVGGKQDVAHLNDGGNLVYHAIGVLPCCLKYSLQREK